MAKHGKKYLEALKLVDRTKLYDPSRSYRACRKNSY
jgi:hypothetical protein